MYLDTQGIEKLVKQYESDTKAIKDELMRICWFMRGSVSYFDSLMLDVDEREIIGKLIKDNLETTKESGMPFF